MDKIEFNRKMLDELKDQIDLVTEKISDFWDIDKVFIDNALNDINNAFQEMINGVDNLEDPSKWIPTIIPNKNGVKNECNP